MHHYKTVNTVLIVAVSSSVEVVTISIVINLMIQGGVVAPWVVDIAMVVRD